MSKYAIAWADTSEGLMLAVNSEVGNGFVPSGPMVVIATDRDGDSVSGTGWMFYQPLFNWANPAGLTAPSSTSASASNTSLESSE